MTINQKNKSNFLKSSFHYNKKCAFDRKCFTHKDKTNGIFCKFLKKYIGKNNINVLCLDSELTKTSNMLIDEKITTKENIILIEGNKKNHLKQNSKGFNSIFGNCNDVITEYYLDKFDGIYLDAIGFVCSVSKLVFESIKNNLTNDKCVIGYTFVRRGNIKGSKFETAYGEFLEKRNLLLENYGYKLIDSESYSYGAPRKKQANMFTEFIYVEKK
jgi:hypothetical protein